jgi:thiol-disulfide isomerase/thioredoxin
MVGRRCCSVAVLLLALLLGAASISMSAQLGDPAPELKVSTWVKGGPVKLAEGKGKNIFVIEFWATWCAPCKETMPHLTALQKKLKDKGVVFVGVSPEDAATVKAYVDKMGSKTGYAVAADDRAATTRAYCQAFGINVIPYAFVIDREGRIAWHGHPLGGLGEVIEMMLAGEYDIRTVELYRRTFQLMARYFDTATKQLSPSEKKGLAALGDRIVGLASETKNALFLNSFAWGILKEEHLEERDVELALRAAKEAYDMSEGKHYGVADTYAWALFENGRVAEAVEMEKRALELCEDEEKKAKLRETIEDFEQKAGASG